MATMDFEYDFWCFHYGIFLHNFRTFTIPNQCDYEFVWCACNFDDDFKTSQKTQIYTENMKIKISLQQLIIANILLFVISFLLIKFSDFYRLNKETHWIYQYAHSFYILFSFPITMLSSIFFSILSIKKLNPRILWMILSLLPIIIFIILPYLNNFFYLTLKNIWLILN